MKGTYASRALTGMPWAGRWLGRRFARSSDTPLPAPPVTAKAPCSSSRTLAISPGGVYELRLLIYLDGPEDHRIHPIEGQLTFFDSEGERIPAEFDAHAYRAGDLSRFVVEGFGADLARHDIDDLLVAHRYFVAPPYARQASIELAAPMPFRIAWLECEPLVASWVRDAERIQRHVRKHHRLRLAALPPVLAGKDSGWSRADSAELARIAATELEQISIVTSLWSFHFGWKSALAGKRIECLADEYYKLIDRDERQGPAIAFIGGERLYNKLLAHFDVMLVPEEAPEELLDAASVKALVIESVAEDLNGEWCQAWCGLAEGNVAPAGQRLLDAVKQRGLPIIFYYTAAPGSTWLFSRLIQLADHIFVEGREADYADGRLRGAEERAHFVPRSFERLLARPMRDDVRDGYAVLYPCCSDLFQYPELRHAIAALPPAATLITEVTYDFVRRATRFLGLSGYQFSRTSSHHEALWLFRQAGIVVLAERSLLNPERQQDLLLDAVASGSVVLYLGDPGRLGELARCAIGVNHANRLNELLRLLGNDVYRERQWLEAYREICRSNTFDRVASKLSAVISRRELTVRPPLASMIVVTKRPHLLSSCIDRFHAQSYPHKELVIILNEAGDIEPHLIDAPNVRIVQISCEHNIGFALNAAIRASSGFFWFKVDDDDYYDAHYLEDMVNTFLYSNADIVGKPPAIYYLQAKELLVIGAARIGRRRRSVRAGQYISGATLSGRSDRNLSSFSQTMRNAVDSQWVEEAIAKGNRIVFSSSAGFVICRSGDKSGHTYLISDEEILARGENQIIMDFKFRHSLGMEVSWQRD